MPSATCSTASDLRSAIAVGGFAFVHGSAMRELLAPHGAPHAPPHGALTDWARFAASWNQLELDNYMADGGRYRRRRHAVYAAAGGGPIQRQAHRAHIQTLDYNPVNGGGERWFEPVDPQAGAGPSLLTILRFCRELFDSLAGSQPDWHIEVHQFRIEARPNEQGRPTPEGLHRDGVDYVLVLLINRRNIARGVTTIHSPDGRILGQFTLTDPFDAALVDDERVAHGVTPVAPIDPRQPAYRDVLVVTFAATVRT